jgi:hypothetical protein
MALSRVKQAVQERHPTLGVDPSLISELISLCKGRETDRHSDWFYQLFLDRPHTTASSIDEVQMRLAQAWWVEEEDISQQILMYVWQFLRDDISKYVPVKMILARNLRDYLISDQKVFTRHRSLLYTQDPFEKQVLYGPEIIFDQTLKKFNTFDRYLIYLWCVLELPRRDLCKVLLQSPRQVNRLTTDLHQRIMEDN